MTDRIDPDNWPSPQGPWPEVTDLNRLYDHGHAWCVNAAGHPDPQGGYPDPDRHLPWHECRGPAAFVDGRRDLDGEPVEMSVYVAAPFRFGQPRDLPRYTSPRLVIDTWEPATDGPPLRISMNPGDALRLARIINHLIDDVIVPAPTT